MLEPLRRVLLVVGEVEDQAGMHVLEDAVPFGARELVDGVDGALGVVGAEGAPGAEQRRREIGHRSLGGLAELRAGFLVVLGLERLHAEHEVGVAVVAIELDQAIGEPRRFIDVAVGEHGVEGGSSSSGFFGSVRSAAR